MPVSDGNAIAMIEVKGLSRGLRAASHAAHAAAVTVDGVGYIHAGMVMLALRGDVASVGAAMTSAVDALGGSGAVHATGVIPRPDPGVADVVAQRSLIRPGGRGFGGTGGIGRSILRWPGRAPLSGTGRASP